MKKPIVLGLAVLLAACAQQTEPNRPAQQPSPPAEPSPTERQELAVTAVEYEFEGMPAEITAGEVTIDMDNAGQEPHEMSIVRILTDTPLQELVELPERRAMQQIENAGHLFARPGEAQARTFTFDAGRYGYVCFVSTKKSDGAPHAFLGMAGEFTVA
jgi:plastocyanin